MKKLFGLALVLLALIVVMVQTPVHANDYTNVSEKETEEEMIDADSEEVDEAIADTTIDSFELFWPVVAGKTRGDSFYFLKRFKENVRGWLIFGDAKDAEYNLFLATKRVVEAEKLINEDKHDLARETLEDAGKNVSKAADEWSDVDGDATTIKHEMNNKLDNLEKFLPHLASSTENEDLMKEIGELLQSVTSLNESV